MKNLSRLTALLLALVMLLSITASATEGVGEESQNVLTEQNNGLVDEQSNPLTLSMWQDMSYQALYNHLLSCDSAESLDSYLGSIDEESYADFRASLSQEELDALDAHIANLYGGYNGFTAEEVATFTKGFKVNGSCPTGSALRSALFSLSGDAFALAVNQMSYDQAGSLESVVSDSEASEISDAMRHSGFDVSGTSADLSGTTYNLRKAARLMTAAATAPVWPNEGAIKLDKDAVAVEGAKNIWEVTLQIQGKNYKTTSDVVLVLDKSGSMSGTKLTNTKKAAKAFGNKLLTEGSTTRIAIVTFSESATAYNNGHFYTSDELSAFETAVDNAMSSVNGGTNQQAGLHVADQLLSSSSGVQKNIVILSDGEATFSYRFIVGTAGWANCSTYELFGTRHTWNDYNGGQISDVRLSGTITPDYSTVIGNGSDYSIGDGNAYVSVTCEHGNTRTYQYGSVSSAGVFSANGTNNNGDATIWEANQIKAKGTTIYSVALQAGTNGETVLKNCASDSSKGYYKIASNESDVAGKLTSAFEAIAGSIAIAASQGTVIDPMGEKVELSYSGTDPVVTNDLSVYNAGNADVYISQGSITYNTSTHQFDWTVGNVNEGVPVILKYKVGIREGVSVATGEVIPTNKTTLFNYKDYQQNDATGEFPIPNVTLGGGTIMVHWYLVNDDGQPINADGVVVEGKEFAYQLQAADYHSVDGSIALEYGTPYTISADSFDGYAYYNYTWNTQVGTASSVAVTIPGSASSQHVWFAYTEQTAATLTIKKYVEGAIENQSFIFDVTCEANDYSAQVAITGAGEVTLVDLEPGTYTVTENTGWSWEYTVDDAEKSETLAGGDAKTIEFTNTAKPDKWLSDESAVVNEFATK